MRGSKKLAGFTLVELVVVVLILGILAAVAVPRFLDTSRTATDGAARHTLSVIRTAIEKFEAEHGALPGADGNENTLKADLEDYLRGGLIPKCKVDGARENAVDMRIDGDPLPGQGQNVGTHSWVYSYDTGEFHINCPEISADGETPYCEF